MRDSGHSAEQIALNQIIVAGGNGAMLEMC